MVGKFRKNRSCFSYDICSSVFLDNKKNSCLLLRFLPNLRTFRGPSLPFLFLMIQYSVLMCYSCYLLR